MKRSLFVVLGVFVFLGAPSRLAATKLKPETIRDWETYVQLTEKRIAFELDGTSGFLRADFPASRTSGSVDIIGHTVTFTFLVPANSYISDHLYFPTFRTRFSSVR
jgi:hypothetical protein